MKKIMIALAAVAMVAGVQAASVQWKMGSSIKPDGKNNAATGTLNTYIYVFDSAPTMTAAEAWTTYGANGVLANITGWDASIIGKSGATGGSATGSLATESGVAKSYYTVVINTWDETKDGKADKYAVNFTEVKINTAGTVQEGHQNLALYNGGKSAGGALTWQNVPEPTSAMLMLLGFAGLALRRRRA